MPEAVRDTDTALDYRAFTLDDLETAVALAPRNRVWREQLDETATEWHDYATAARAWQELTVLDPNDANAFYQLGRRTYQLGEYARSLTAFGEARKLDPKNAAFIFGQGLAYLTMGDLQAAMQSYRLGVQAANAQTNNRTRDSWYTEAIDDLEGTQIDPMHAADMFVRFVGAGWGRLLFGQTCTVVYSGPDGLSVRSGMGTAYVRGVAVMTKEAEFIALERSPDGLWLHGLVKELGVPGWVQNLPEFIKCNDGVAAVPVDEALIQPTPAPTATP